MRQPIPTGKTLLESGHIACDAHLEPGDNVDRVLYAGDTYADEPCDYCPAEKLNG